MHELKSRNSVLNSKYFKMIVVFIVLVFGNTGFVGSWLSLSLNLFEANVLGVSLKMNNSSYLSNTIQFKKK